MSRPCTICSSPSRDKIDRALLGYNGTKPLSLRDTAEKFNVSKSALGRHTPHLARAIIKDPVVAERVHAELVGHGVLSQIRILNATAMEWLGKAEHAEDGRMVAVFIRSAMDCLELQAKVEKLVGSGISLSVNVLTDPDFIAITDRMYRVLEPYPDIRAEIAAAMES